MINRDGQLTDEWFVAQAAQIAAEHKAYEASLNLDSPDIWTLSEPVGEQNHDWINYLPGQKLSVLPFYRGKILP